MLKSLSRESEMHTFRSKLYFLLNLIAFYYLFLYLRIATKKFA
jgi:hypothetical protein